MSDLSCGDRVRALVLVDVALGSDAGDTEAPSWAIFATIPGRAGRCASSLVASFLTNPLFHPALLELFIADPAQATPARVKIYRQPWW